ncbi:MAG: hypothetical protein HY673_09850 [Chloroflexi bacterium]|nr:hypothetical protein [Chloroflexota bacterium]
MDTNTGVILFLGIVLGIRHAFDADHLVAVSTIVSQYRNPFRSLWVGISWGLGHTTTLLLAGAAILFFKLSFFQDYSYIFEIAVGVMLVFLGLQVFWTLWRGKAHLHGHEHERETHWHIHPHRKTPGHDHHTPSLWPWRLPPPIAGIALRVNSYLARMLGRPFFRLKSYLVGTVHGLAGSAALMLLVLGALPSLETGILYIIVFGLGSTLAMGVTTIFISMPFTLSGRLPTFNRVLQVVAASFSIFLGILLISGGR